jgi:hypothetical protein
MPAVVDVGHAGSFRLVTKILVVVPERPLIGDLVLSPTSA